jgi:hypothetical protein
LMDSLRHEEAEEFEEVRALVERVEQVPAA